MTDHPRSNKLSKESIIRQIIFVCLVIISLLSLPAPWIMAGEVNHESQIKAALIHHITRFVQWPWNDRMDSSESFGLYILGEDSLTNAFDPFVGEMIHEKPLAVIKISDLREIPPDCRVLYIGLSKREEIRHVLDKVSGRAILTISDEPWFTELGGTVGLIKLNDHIHFSVNTFSARQAGLCVSSNLIKIALSVQGEMR